MTLWLCQKYTTHGQMMVTRLLLVTNQGKALGMILQRQRMHKNNLLDARLLFPLYYCTDYFLSHLCRIQQEKWLQKSQLGL